MQKIKMERAYSVTYALLFFGKSFITIRGHKGNPRCAMNLNDVENRNYNQALILKI
jgi:hypothetical protein